MSIQQNVAQQNAIVRRGIMNCASSYLEDPQSDPWLTSFLTTHGLDPAGGLPVRFGYRPYQGGDWFYVTWLTDAGHFWDIEVLVPYDGSELEVFAFEDITATTETSAHVRGTGKSFGCLALEVQAELLGASKP